MKAAEMKRQTKSKGGIVEITSSLDVAINIFCFSSSQRKKKKLKLIFRLFMGFCSTTEPAKISCTLHADCTFLHDPPYLLYKPRLGLVHPVMEGPAWGLAQKLPPGELCSSCQLTLNMHTLLQELTESR